jgi:hypothetical protein
MPQCGQTERRPPVELGRGVVLGRALAPAAAGVADVSFLDRPDAAQRLAEHGPIAMINVSTARSDAILLTRDGLSTRPLPDLTPADLRETTARFLVAAAQRRYPGASADEATAADDTLTEVLRWLWETVAEPVLSNLGLTGRPQGQPGAMPRLWWCPTGLLSLLPLPAAGVHSSAWTHGSSVLDVVVPSVTPSLRALVRARQRPSGDGKRGTMALSRTLAVAMSDTPGETALPAASAEVRMLADLFPGAVTRREGSMTDRRTVLADMARHSRLHLACHAVADPVHPSRSRILLADHRDHPLTAADIARLELPGADFAFLSACETGLTAAALADESVHLGSALQVAGYRHVVATLWAVADRPAARLSRDVWTAVAQEGDSARVPYAVHAAVRRLRQRYPRRPWAWAAHVHLGP